MFVIKTMMEEEMLENVRKVMMLKKAWDTFTTLFTKVDDAWLQLLENKLMSFMQENITINQYFNKVKTPCHEIIELDLDSNIPKKHMKRIIIYELRLEYRNFIASIQDWPTQSTILELENLLANQEALAEQLAKLEHFLKVKRKHYLET